METSSGEKTAKAIMGRRSQPSDPSGSEPNSFSNRKLTVYQVSLDSYLYFLIKAKVHPKNK
jgi:hypothetical protein